MQLPTGSTHLKVIRIEPDLRATMRYLKIPFLLILTSSSL